MSTTGSSGDLGLAITTIGRPAIRDLLRSAAESTCPPSAVAIADQSGRNLKVEPEDYPFSVRTVASRGGISAGRNDAMKLLPPNVRIIGFPNDDSAYPPTSLQSVVACFEESNWPDAVACSLVERSVHRYALPPDGTRLDRSTVWRAVEPALFVLRESIVNVGGFRIDIGSGAASPWQSGEGTDLLLRLIADSGRIISQPSIEVIGPGERRQLTTKKWISKQYNYARGTGYVYRIHPYPPYVRIRIVLSPFVRAVDRDAKLPVSLRIALARSFGRLEGLLGRPLLGRPTAAPRD